MTSTNIYTKNPLRYYVYAYIRSSDSKTAKAGTPYYIGKGTARRIYEKHSIHIPKNKSYIIIMETNLSDVGALALERRYIKWYGRIDINTGILHNKTDGGDGASGSIRPSCSTDTKIRISNSVKLYHETVSSHIKDEIQIKRTNTTNNNKENGTYIPPNLNRKWNDEYKNNMKIACSGIPKTLEHNIKNSISNTGRVHIANTITKVRKRPLKEEALLLIQNNPGVWIKLATQTPIPDYTLSNSDSISSSVIIDSVANL